MGSKRARPRMAEAPSGVAPASVPLVPRDRHRQRPLPIDAAPANDDAQRVTLEVEGGQDPRVRGRDAATVQRRGDVEGLAGSRAGGLLPGLELMDAGETQRR